MFKNQVNSLKSSGVDLEMRAIEGIAEDPIEELEKKL